MLTSDPIYFKPYKPRITIKSLDNLTTYYTYDPWTDVGTTAKAISCNVNLSQNHQGIFEVQIEDETRSLNTSQVGLGARCIIECGKQSTQMTRLISGLVRQNGYSRGADKRVVYTLRGSSTAIRHNERILYLVVENNYGGGGYYLRQGYSNSLLGNPANAYPLSKDDERSIGILDTTRIDGLAGAGVSVPAQIGNINIQFGELQDYINYLEEQTGGEIFIDVNDGPSFRDPMDPYTSGRGFTIKNVKATNDNADDTMYLRGKSWDYSESALKSDSYSSRIFGILPADTVPSTREQMGYLAGFNQLNMSATQEHAQKFRPTHSHFLPGDLLVVGIEEASVANTKAWTPRFRICQDSGGLPLNAGGIVANIDFLPNQFDSPLSISGSAILQDVLVDQIFYNTSGIRIDSFDLDTTKDYWLIASNDNIPAAAGNVFYWASKPGGTGLFFNNTAGLSTNSAGGSGWASAGAFTSIFSFPRRAQAFECSDHKARSAIGLIESMLPGVTATVKNRYEMYLYLTNQMYWMARPRANWNMATVTAPNVPVLPGDPIMISDDVMGFSTANNQVVMTTCGDMTYSWQVGQYQAPTILSIQPVSNPNHYK